MHNETIPSWKKRSNIFTLCHFIIQRRILTRCLFKQVFLLYYFLIQSGSFISRNTMKKIKNCPMTSLDKYKRTPKWPLLYEHKQFKDFSSFDHDNNDDPLGKILFHDCTQNVFRRLHILPTTIWPKEKKRRTLFSILDQTVEKSVENYTPLFCSVDMSLHPLHVHSTTLPESQVRYIPWYPNSPSSNKSSSDHAVWTRHSESACCYPYLLFTSFYRYSNSKVTKVN